MNVTVIDLELSAASPRDAADMVSVIHEAFGARPPLNPPSTAIDETPDTIAAALAQGGGLFATVNGRPAGALVIAAVQPGLATFQRVSVHPDFQRHGVASAMVAAAQEYAAELGFDRVELFAREEFADLIQYWQHRGFEVVRTESHGVVLGKVLPVMITVSTGAAMQDLGERMSELFRAGDLLIASGDLGAGKTTLTQGIGRGLGSVEPVISPTFVISRVHRSTTGRPDLVHVDAYRLTGGHEIDDLDLDASMAGAVTVVEWGAGVAEPLADDRLEVEIRTSPVVGRSVVLDSERTVLLRPVGERWRGVDLHSLRGFDG